LLTPGGDSEGSPPSKAAIGHYDRPWRKAMSKNPLNYEMTDGSLA